MKSLLLPILIAASFAATASVTCSSDGYGNTTCYDSDGGSSDFHDDGYGNTYGQDSDGNSVNCYSDGYGNTTCY